MYKSMSLNPNQFSSEYIHKKGRATTKKIDVNLFSWIQLSKESVPMER